MPLTNLTEVDAYTPTCKAPQDGDKIDAVTVSSGLQSLANRTNHHNLHAIFDTTKDGGSGYENDLNVAFADGTTVSLYNMAHLDNSVELYATGATIVHVATTEQGAKTEQGTRTDQTTRTMTGALNLNSSLIPSLGPARTWKRRAKRWSTSAYDSDVPGGRSDKFGVFNAPSLYVYDLGTVFNGIAEIDNPPDAGIITGVSIKSRLATDPGGSITRPTYKLVKYVGGLTGDADVISDVVTDTHASNGSDWNTTKTTSLTGIDASEIDLQYGYGIWVEISSGMNYDLYLDIAITGTIAKLKGT